MARQVKLLKALSLVVAVALVITLAPPVSVIGEEVITLTTIMPGQDTLRVERGVVGVDWRPTATLSDEDIGPSNLLIQGNVGIGTTSPSEKLEVNGAIKVGNTTGTNAGTIRWTGTAFEGYNGTSWIPLDGISFGNRSVLATVSTTVNAGVTNIDVAATQAVKEGEFICVIEWTGADWDQGAVAVGYSDSNLSPSTILGYANVDWSYNSIRWASYSFIVKKDDYYKAEWKGIYGNNAPVTRKYYWLPIGN